MKKYTLTPEHKEILATWKDKWIENAMSTRPMDDNDRDQMRIAVRGLYESAGLTPPPDERIVFVPSPFVARFAAGFAASIWWQRGQRRASTSGDASDAVEEAANDAVDEATYDATSDATYTAVDDAAYTAAYTAVDAATYAATDAATFAAARHATYAATDAATFAAVDDATSDATHAATSVSTSVATYDATHAATNDAVDDATSEAVEDATRAAIEAAANDATYDATTYATYAAVDEATYDAEYAATETATETAVDDATETATYNAANDATYDAAYAAVDAATYAATEDATRDATHDATYDATSGATYDATHAAIRDATRDATDDAINAAAEVNKNYFSTTAGFVAAGISLGVGEFGFECAKRSRNMYQGGNFWSWNDAFITFFRDVAKLDIDYSKYQYWEKSSLHGSCRMMHKEFCIISDRPRKLKVDDQNRPHCEDGAFCEWADGMKIYAWHGEYIPEYWITQPELLTPEVAIKWENIEQRRAACEILGWARILKELNATTVEKDSDPQIGELLEVEIPDIGKEKFLRVLCGTGREFALPVPPEMNTALEANAWTYGLEPKDYMPEIRT